MMTEAQRKILTECAKWAGPETAAALLAALSDDRPAPAKPLPCPCCGSLIGPEWQDDASMLCDCGCMWFPERRAPAPAAPCPECATLLVVGPGWNAKYLLEKTPIAADGMLTFLVNGASSPACNDLRAELATEKSRADAAEARCAEFIEQTRVERNRRVDAEAKCAEKDATIATLQACRGDVVREQRDAARADLDTANKLLTLEQRLRRDSQDEAAALAKRCRDAAQAVVEMQSSLHSDGGIWDDMTDIIAALEGRTPAASGEGRG